MTQNAFTIISFWFTQGWRFLTSFYIPGTNVTPAGMLFFLLFIRLAISFVRRLTELDNGGANEK